MSTVLWNPPPRIKELLARYQPRQVRVIEEYFAAVAKTRKTGMIAASVMARELEYWEKFEPELVVMALTVHLKKHRGKREAYTRGIMRGLSRELESKLAETKRGNYGRRNYGDRYIDGNDESSMPF